MARVRAAGEPGRHETRDFAGAQIADVGDTAIRQALGGERRHGQWHFLQGFFTTCSRDDDFLDTR